MISKKTRKLYFERLDLGEYNEKNIKKLQKKYLRKKDVDGIYGKNTDILLRNLYRTKVYSPHFDLTEFKCECGGKYCTGYPKLLNIQMLLNLEALREQLGVPITITSGIRDKIYNSHLAGSIPNSYHLYGEAVDFCCSKTSSLAKRKDIMKVIAKQRGFHFTYCNGWQIGIGYSCSRKAPNMGTSIHFEVKHGQTSKKADREKALQKYLESKKKCEVPEVKPECNSDKYIDNMMAWCKKIVNDNSYVYKKYGSDPKQKECPICHPELKKYKKYKGWNCIGFASAAIFHGLGYKKIKCACNGLCNDAFMQYDKITLAKWKKRNGDAWELVGKNKDGVPKSKLQKGDIVNYYDGKTWKHIAVYCGNGYVYEAASLKSGIVKGKYLKGSKLVPKVVFRPTYRGE